MRAQAEFLRFIAWEAPGALTRGEVMSLALDVADWAAAVERFGARSDG